MDLRFGGSRGCLSRGGLETFVVGEESRQHQNRHDRTGRDRDAPPVRTPDRQDRRADGEQSPLLRCDCKAEQQRSPHEPATHAGHHCPDAHRRTKQLFWVAEFDRVRGLRSRDREKHDQQPQRPGPRG